MITIIIPVYNVEKYLAKCIDSILSQTFTDWELILIDDGSKDKSGKICDEYSCKDKRIKVFHKKNEGVSKARNKGIELAKGEYICFIDSDDWIESTYLKDFKIEQQYDFYFSGALYDTYNKVYSYKKYTEKYCKNKSEIKAEFFKQDLFSNGYPWGKLYKTQIIKDNKLRFNESLAINEDHIFVFQYFSCIKTLYIANTAGYHYTVFDDSGRKLSSKINSYTELKAASEQFSSIINHLKVLWNISSDQYENLYNVFVAFKRLSAFRSLILLKEKRFFKEELNYWNKSSYLGCNKKEKVILFILRSKYILGKFYLCYILYNLIQIRNRYNCQKQVYRDLNSRSIKL
jgi:glycosyltransferase involved in cell wall biosynthesis